MREGFTIKTFLKFFHCWEISVWFFVSDFLLNSFPSHKISTLPLKKSHFENWAYLILFFKTLELNSWNLIVIFWVILWLQNWKLRILISTKPKIKKCWKCSFLRENFSKSLYSLNLKVWLFFKIANVPLNRFLIFQLIWHAQIFGYLRYLTHISKRQTIWISRAQTSASSKLKNTREQSFSPPLFWDF